MSEEEFKKAVQFLEPLPKGTYRGTIVAISPPRESLPKPTMVFCIQTVLIEERKLYNYIGGYRNTCNMIYNMRKHWIGMEVDVIVRIEAYNNEYRNIIDVKWPDLGD